MPNALPQGPGSRTFTGARAMFYFNGELVAYASGCSGSEEILYEAIDAMDDLAPKEHAAVGYRVTFNAAIFRTIARGQISTTDAPGSLKEQQIFPRFNQILTTEGCDVVLLDRLSGKPVEFLERVKPATRNWNMDARSTMRSNVGFVCIKSKDESEVRGVLTAA